jgi:hypothetical protein
LAHRFTHVDARSNLNASEVLAVKLKRTRSVFQLLELREGWFSSFFKKWASPNLACNTGFVFHFL